jgi:hypothetical protein
VAKKCPLISHLASPQITTFETAASEYASSQDVQKSKAADKNGEFDSDDSDSDGQRFGKSVKKGKGKKGAGKKSAGHALFGVKWLRIVVGECGSRIVGAGTSDSTRYFTTADEAQNIKNRQTKKTKACVALQAKYRWCLTG